MIFTESKLKGVCLIEPEPVTDNRGFFARTFCREAFTERGMRIDFAQCSVSFNRSKGTLRGMHYQVEPYREAKVVRCTMGALYDVVVDMRPDSPTFRQWASFELSAENRHLVYVPEGFAHGFLTREDNTEVFYMITEFYHRKAARGVRWDDPAFGIEWPDEVRVLSDRDAQYPDFEP